MLWLKHIIFEENIYLQHNYIAVAIKNKYIYLKKECLLIKKNIYKMLHLIEFYW